MKRYIIYSLMMNKKKAKLKYNHNSFDIIEDGDLNVLDVIILVNFILG